MYIHIYVRGNEIMTSAQIYLHNYIYNNYTTYIQHVTYVLNLELA